MSRIPISGAVWSIFSTISLQVVTSFVVHAVDTDSDVMALDTPTRASTRVGKVALRSSSGGDRNA